jgi:hypothetical protein
MSNGFARQPAAPRGGLRANSVAGAHIDDRNVLTPRPQLVMQFPAGHHGHIEIQQNQSQASSWMKPSASRSIARLRQA